jgi:tape measure domain-containing protein
MAQTIAELVVQISAENADLKAKLNESVKATDSAFGKIGKSILAAGAAAQVFSGIIDGIDFNKAAEQAQVSFEIMTGSAQTATKILKELKDFANTTPLEFTDIRDATQRLLAMGIAADEVIPLIKDLGDVSGGNAEKLNRLSMVFGQISTKGRLMGDDLMQLREIGFDPLAEISRTTGESIAALSDKMSKGQISVNMVREAFVTATSEGGRFNGMLERQGQTLAGVQSTMSDAFKTFQGAATQSLTEPLKALMSAGTVVLNFLTDLPAPLLAAATAFVSLGAAIGAIVTIAPTFGIALSASFGPIGIAIAGAVAGITLVVTLITDAINKQKALDEALAGTSKKSIEDQKALIEAELKANNDRIKWATDRGKADEAMANLAKKQVAELNKANEALYARIRDLNREESRQQTAAAEEKLKKDKETAAAELNIKTEAAKKASAEKLKIEEESNEALFKMQMDFSDRQTQEFIDAEMAKLDAELKRIVDAEAADKAAFDAMAREEANERALRKDADDDRLQAIKDQEAAEIKRRGEVLKTLTDAAGLAAGVSSVFAKMGGEGAKTISQVSSLASDIIKLIASEGSDTEAWFSVIGKAIEMAFHGDTEAAEEFNAQLDGAVKILTDDLKPIWDIIISSLKITIPIIELIGVSLKPILPLLEAVAKVVGWTSDAFSMISAIISGDQNSIDAKWKAFTKSVEDFFKGDVGKIIAALATGGVSLAGDSSINGVGANDAGRIVKGDTTTDTAISGILGVATGGLSTIIQLIGSAIGVKHASGTDFASGGMALVGEQGPELVNLPRGSQVIANQNIGSAMNSGATINIYSPIAVDPSEASSIMRQSMRELAFQGAF